MANVYSIEKVKNLFTKVSLTNEYKLEIKVSDSIKKYIDNTFADSLNSRQNNNIKTGPDNIFNRGDSASFGGLDEKVSIMCRSVQIPGASVEYETMFGARQGISEIFPTYRTNLALDCTFYVDKDHDVIRFFQRWLNLINPTIRSEGNLGINVPGVESRTGTSSGLGVNNPSNFYRMGYKDDYVCDISLVKFEKDSFGDPNRFKPIKSKDSYSVNGLKYTFYRAFPVDISSVPLSYDNPDILQMSVTFEYERYSVA